MIRRAAHLAIRAYQLSFSAIAGSQCRHLPTCSSYMDEAIARHGVWAGGFMGLARLCRCQPWGTAGFDPVPDAVPVGARWWKPWLYGLWRGPLVVDWESTSGKCAKAGAHEPVSAPPRRHSTH